MSINYDRLFDETRIMYDIPCNQCESRQKGRGEYHFPDGDGFIEIDWFTHMMCNENPQNRERRVYCNTWHTAYNYIPDRCYQRFHMIREELEEI